MSHTPGEWKVLFGGTVVAESDPAFNEYTKICEAIPDNAHMIVRAVNNHADLLETLEIIASFAVGHGDVCEIIAQRARAAILKANG